jgi:hypothetical protein
MIPNRTTVLHVVHTLILCLPDDCVQTSLFAAVPNPERVLAATEQMYFVAG